MKSFFAGTIGGLVVVTLAMFTYWAVGAKTFWEVWSSSSGWVAVIVTFLIGIATLRPIAQQALQQKLINRVTFLQNERNSAYELIDYLMFLEKDSSVFEFIATVQRLKNTQSHEAKLEIGSEVLSLLRKSVKELRKAEELSIKCLDNFAYRHEAPDEFGIDDEHYFQSILGSIDNLTHKLSNLNENLNNQRFLDDVTIIANTIPSDARNWKECAGQYADKLSEEIIRAKGALIN